MRIMGDGKQLSVIHGMERLKCMLGAGKRLPERLCWGQLENWLEPVPESQQFL